MAKSKKDATIITIAVKAETYKTITNDGIKVTALKKNPHAEHRVRLKARFKKEGIDGFQHHQVLELLLFFGIVQKDTNELAHDLINRFGSFSKVLDAPYEELLKVKGIGDHTATLIKLFPAVARVYFDDM